MATTEQKPNLYSLYNKQYDFDEFQRAADSGVSEYISSLKRGNKHAEQFMQAYSDLMAGIKDGSITFKDGKYVDSRGRYSNNKYYNDKNEVETTRRPSKDYYGLMANYIYKKQLAQNEYTPPKKKEDLEKIKWNGNNSVGQAITKHIFNSDTWNNAYFQNLNTWDDDGKIVGDDKRIPKLREAFQYTKDNFDKLFIDYDDAQKQEAIDYITKAMASLDDDSVEHDYLDLSKAAGGLDYEKMFANKTVEKPVVNPKEAFVSYINTRFKHPIQNPNGNIEAVATITSQQQQKNLENISNNINDMDEQRLNNIIKNALQSPNDMIGSTGIPMKFMANLAALRLINKYKLEPIQEDSSLYYMPFTNDEDSVTTWVYDKDSATFKQMSYFDIPQMRQKIFNEFQATQGPQNTLPEHLSGFESMFASSYKRGGVIKAQTGVKLNTEKANWYEGVFKNQLDHILDKLKQDSGYYNWLNNMQDSHYGLYTAAKGDKESIDYSTAYQNKNVGEYQDAYKSGYNQEFNDKAGYNNLGILNALKAGMFDISGGTRTSGDYYREGNPNNWTSDNLFSAITDYRRLLGRKGDFDDNQLAELKAKFKEAGYDFDLDDATQYYKLKPLLSLSDEGPKSLENYSKEHPITINGAFNEMQGSEIRRRWEKQNGENNVGKKILDFSTSFIPNAIGLGQLLGTIRSNNKRADIIKRSMIPLQKITYEHKIPITGAFSEMQFSNSQAANSRSKGNRWFTSDPSLQLGGEHAYNAQAMEQERRGFLADDAEIKRTKAESLKEEKENKARRAETINFNTAARIQNAKELAQLEAARLKQNRLSIDNYTTELKDQLSRMLQEEKTRRDAFKYNVYQQDINEQYSDILSKVQDKVAEWQAQDENKDKSVSEMPGYYSFLKALSQWRTAKLLGANAKIYGYNYNNKNLNKTAQEIASEFSLLKNGGTLRPSILHMINKTLRNENNT